MEVISKCALRVAHCVWRPRASAWALTVVVKATYRLVPGTAQLLPPDEQEGINDEDSHWDDDPSQSLAAAADLVPFKPRCDVVLVGGAFAPSPAMSSFVARLCVGKIDKSIRVFGRRYLRPDGTIDAAFAQKVRLRYERAAGGPRTANPVGMPAGVRTEHGTPLPYLQPIDADNAKPFERPIGFGPVAATWPERQSKAPAGAADWSMKTWRRTAIPAGLDPSFFNCAPADQQVAKIADDEEIRLENLLPERPVLVTRLPGVRPQVRLERPGVAPTNLAMGADTLWIDTHRGICALTWRGQAALESATAEGTIHVQMDDADDADPIDASDLIEVPDGQSGASQTLLLPQSPVRQAQEIAKTLPFIQPTAEPPVPQPQEAPRQDTPRRRRKSAADETHHLPPDIAHPAPLPFTGSGGNGAKTEPPPPPRKKTAPPPPLPPGVVPPAVVPRAQTPDQGTLGERIAAEKKTSPEDTAAAKEPVAAIGSAASSTSAKPRVGVLSGFKKAPPPPPSLKSAQDASNAVLVKEGAPDAARAWSVTTPVELLWFDPASLDAVRKHDLWKDLLTTVRPKPRDADFEAGPASPKRQEAKDRRELSAVLARGRPESTEELGAALGGAVDEDGSFVPPLSLVAGDIEFPFDPGEALRALVTVTAPLGSLDDGKLRDALDAARGALAAPQLLHVGSLAEKLTRQIVSALAANPRQVTVSDLESLVERMLLDQRHFQRRQLFGQPWLRGVIAPAGSSRSVPCYLPSEASQRLPLLRRFRAQVVAEVRPPLDRDDAGPVCLRIAALGRTLPGRW